MERHPVRDGPGPSPAERVRQALENDPDVRGERILVEVDEGTIVLRGHVIDEEEHEKAVEAALRELGEDRVRDLLAVHWMQAVEATAWAGYVEERLRRLDRRLAEAPLRVAAAGNALEIWGRVPDRRVRDRILRVIAGLRIPRILDRLHVMTPD